MDSWLLILMSIVTQVIQLVVSRNREEQSASPSAAALSWARNYKSRCHCLQAIQGSSFSIVVRHGQQRFSYIDGTKPLFRPIRMFASRQIHLIFSRNHNCNRDRCVKLHVSLPPTAKIKMSQGIIH
ncbi:hypothetical protein PoB_006421900 [Plakobranchus ocellatus]|uniref:Secreted protein n=1 Tax=Plakobranchus ocellatus TaxID=259542 RepID=A0AAV4D0W2_9GAST|nr:hypothetical protein PoB_006421900 [Plakobranchus ocellatus]